MLLGLDLLDVHAWGLPTRWRPLPVWPKRRGLHIVRLPPHRYLQSRWNLWLWSQPSVQPRAALRQWAVPVRCESLPQRVLQQCQLRTTVRRAMRLKREQLFRLLGHPGQQLLLHRGLPVRERPLLLPWSNLLTERLRVRLPHWVLRQ
jgi:hypothetical protein